jgi:hypothetical protein
MDKLPEPEFTPDQKWKRLLHGTEPLLTESEKSFYKWFGVLTAGSIYKYWREITFYKKNYLQFLAIAGLFTFTSYNIAKLMSEDPYVLAAVKNNEAERQYINSYRALYKEFKAKNLQIPNNLIL